MFVSDGALPHLLRPADYSSAEAYAQEEATVFRSSWNAVAACDQLAAPGQQLATEIGGLPVVVRNDGGTLRAYRNVCAHRHSLVARPGFTCSQVLRCQYHGWEYGRDGRLTKLPDGRSFKGWKVDAQLETLRCEVAWNLVFVNPTPGSTTLRDDLGAISPDLDEQFRDKALHWISITEHDVNWKVIVENAVEGYHVPLVHPESFGTTLASEESTGHVLGAMFTQFHDLHHQITARDRRLEKLLFRSRHAWGYSHTHVFPNNLVLWAGLYREWVVIQPLGPRRCRRIAYAFFPSDFRESHWVERAVAAIARWVRAGAERVFREDESLWAAVQRGTESSSFAGVLSAREERVAAFQHWLVAQRESSW